MSHDEDVARILRDRERADAKEAEELAKLRAEPTVTVKMKRKGVDQNCDTLMPGDVADVAESIAMTWMENGVCERGDPIPVKRKAGRPKKAEPDED